ncbi:MAG: GNAT family N-acetyltransferase [Chitinispirillaceae bacterium]|nr:GNAT family N-acetyltransferase [Chitinispirillaceae bacterium]
MQPLTNAGVSPWQTAYPAKFAPVREIFKHIGRGNRLFISTGCGEPQYLVNALVNYVESDPKAFADAEIFQVWTLGVAVYTEEKFNYNFRHNSFFISDKSRDAVNAGLADYTPVFLSRVPDLLQRGQIRFDAALIQTSLPDKNGNVSLGVSVDICKAAIEHSGIVIAQWNANMPRVHGDTFINIKDINYIIRHDEPLLEYSPTVPGEIARQTGRYVAKIINDGDTIQIGYGSLPNAILENLKDKKHLGIHTELLTDGVVDLVQLGVIDNSRKTVDRGRTVASFCMGTEKTYRYIDDNPEMEFRTIEYTNDPLVISRIHNMTAVNSALQIDLTGQASVESVEGRFYSGIGGSADFMRGALLAPGGKTILTMESTARGGTVSRIIPSLPGGTGVTFNRGDIQYVVTEYGIAYLHGKNIRERAMDLIAIAHPKFRERLVEEAKKLNLVYRDQAFIHGISSEYPEYLEEYRPIKGGGKLLFRPVRINDEGLVKEFFYSLSDQSLHNRFMSSRKDMPHRIRQHFVVIDYTKELVVLATEMIDKKEQIVGVGQYAIDQSALFAEVAFAVRDDYQGRGVGSELLAYLTVQAKRKGIKGFTADVLMENHAMLRVFEKTGFDIQKKLEEGVYSLMLRFEKPSGR